jgi:hypothetical protein
MSKMFRLLAVVAIASASVIASDRVHAREVLIPLSDCPADLEAAGECMVGGIGWWGGKNAIPLRKQVGRATITKIYLVKGRLDGGPVKTFALKFVQELDDYFAHTDNSGAVAYQTRAQGRGDLVVLTDKGALRVLTKGLRIELIPNIVVVDEERWQVLARYYDECIDLSFLLRTPPIVIWDEGRRRCVSLEPGKSGVTRAQKCERPKKNACKGVPSHFEPAAGVATEQLDATVRDWRILRLMASSRDGHFGGSGWGIRAYRVAGSRYLVFRGFCNDCY